MSNTKASINKKRKGAEVEAEAGIAITTSTRKALIDIPTSIEVPPKNNKNKTKFLLSFLIPNRNQGLALDHENTKKTKPISIK